VDQQQQDHEGEQPAESGASSLKAKGCYCPRFWTYYGTRDVVQRVICGPCFTLAANRALDEREAA
jgi:hypothetical protein